MHVDPDVLLIDEVLAVGDEAFQAKCLDRVRAFQREGRTIVLVTHALDIVRQICDRAVMLDHGELHAIGMPTTWCARCGYVLLGVTDPNFVPEEGTREAEIAEVQIVRPNGSSEGAILRGDPLTIVIDVRQNEPLDDLDVDFAVLDGATNHAVLDARTSRAGLDLGRFDKKRVRFRIEGFPYEPGKYWVTVGLSQPLHRAPVPRADPAVPVRGLRRAPRAGARRGPGGGGGRGPVTEPATDPATTQTKGTPPMLIVLILFSVTLAAIAQLALKHGMNLVNDELAPQTFSLNGASLRVVVGQPFVWGGLFLFGLSALVWLVVLSRASLSFAYPFAALTLRADPAVRPVRARRDGAGRLRWAGVAFIGVGIILVSQTQHT